LSKEQHIYKLGLVLHSINHTLKFLSIKKSSPKS
jgi:hypothetical protein